MEQLNKEPVKPQDSDCEHLITVESIPMYQAVMVSPGGIWYDNFGLPHFTAPVYKQQYIGSYEKRTDHGCIKDQPSNKGFSLPYGYDPIPNYGANINLPLLNTLLGFEDIAKGNTDRYTEKELQQANTVQEPTVDIPKSSGKEAPDEGPIVKVHIRTEISEDTRNDRQVNDSEKISQVLRLMDPNSWEGNFVEMDYSQLLYVYSIVQYSLSEGGRQRLALLLASGSGRFAVRIVDTNSQGQTGQVDVSQ